MYSFQNLQLTASCELQSCFILWYFYGLDIVDDSIKSHGPLHKKKILGHRDFHILIFSVLQLKEERKNMCSIYL